MNGWKTQLQSKTVWAALIAILASVAGIAGYSISPEEQENVVGLATSVVTGVAGVIAWIGRVQATKRIAK